MKPWQAFVFGCVSYYVFTGLFGMSYFGSVVLSAVCVVLINLFVGN